MLVDMELKYKIGLIASLLFLTIAAVQADDDTSPELEEVAEKLREMDEDDETEDGLPILTKRDTSDPDIESVEYKVRQRHHLSRGGHPPRLR